MQELEKTLCKQSVKLLPKNNYIILNIPFQLGFYSIFHVSFRDLTDVFFQQNTKSAHSIINFIIKHNSSCCVNKLNIPHKSMSSYKRKPVSLLIQFDFQTVQNSWNVRKFTTKSIPNCLYFSYQKTISLITPSELILI